MAEAKNNDQKSTKFKAVPVEPQNIGVETNSDIVSKLADDNFLAKQIDSSILSSFRDISDKRELQYKMYDEMGKDPVISSALELYADDATEYNDDGNVIWVKSDDPDVAKSVDYLIKALKLNESAWGHIHALVKYGDIYLQTFRKSDIDEENGEAKLVSNSDRKALTEKVDNKVDDGKEKAFLLEDVIVNLYSEGDKLEEYIEAVPNPAELFDLVKRGKTNGFLRTKLSPDSKQTNQTILSYNYNVNTDNVKLYDSTKFVHIYLPDTSNRNPESVQLFRNTAKDPSKIKNKEKYQDTLEYNVKRGKSILYDVFKIYRELKLLEDSILLSRLVKSSILRVVQVEVGDMGKAAVQQTLQRIKNLMEQKTSLTEGQESGSYLSPGAIENNIYVPTRENKGTITTQTVGGDVNVGDLTDLDYYNNKLFAGLKIPKPFLGFMDDNAGFSGGESLAKVSSRYAKTIKRVQNAYIQGITTLVNIFLLDRGMEAYVNDFEIKMQSPSTLEDAERLQAVSNKTQLISDIMNVLADIDNSADKLKVASFLIKKYIGDSELDELLEEIVEKQEVSDDEEITTQENDSLNKSIANDLGFDDTSKENNSSLSNDTNNSITGTEDEEDEDTLPNPADLDMDLSDNEEIANELEGDNQ